LIAAYSPSGLVGEGVDSVGAVPREVDLCLGPGLGNLVDQVGHLCDGLVDLSLDADVVRNLQQHRVDVFGVRRIVGVARRSKLRLAILEGENGILGRNDRGKAVDVVVLVVLIHVRNSRDAEIVLVADGKTLGATEVETGWCGERSDGRRVGSPEGGSHDNEM